MGSVPEARIFDLKCNDTRVNNGIYSIYCIWRAQQADHTVQTHHGTEKQATRQKQPAMSFRWLQGRNQGVLVNVVA